MRTTSGRDRTSWRFDGEIAGIGTRTGPRIVIGRWFDSPLGAFADVMVEEPDGHRLLLAPDDAVAEFVASTYSFDEIVLGPVGVTEDDHHRQVRAPGLELELGVGGRPPLGVLLRLQPRAVIGSPVWATLLDPIARVTLRGVRTRGSAGGGRAEFYGASDLHRVVSAGGAWRGADLGGLAPVDPPVRFGFGSAPRTPVLTRLVTTVVVRDAQSAQPNRA
ncbi:MAG TPA: hypothetical protein VFP34_08590 [Microlunatus sp.]|nr:hypothetical protein [Microlunatus sp.]